MSLVHNFNPRTLPHISMMTGNDWRKLGNPLPTNYFKTREMNINECLPYDDMYFIFNYLEYYYDQYRNYSTEQADYNIDYKLDFYYHNSIDFYETYAQRSIK